MKESGSIRLSSLLRKCLFLVVLLPGISIAQKTATITGRVADTQGNPLELVNVALFGTSYGAVTDSEGRYKLEAPAGQYELYITSVGYNSQAFSIVLQPGERKILNAILAISITELPDFELKEERPVEEGLTRIDPKEAKFIPTPGASIEALIKTLPGVYSPSELSYQYNVRGGNYDENLVYVNGVEIYRPFLIRSGQQEGLSFINSDLVSNILFSAGGFDAKYGDKMSSVLDIEYKKPRAFAGSVSGSLLGGAAHFEGASDNMRFTYLVGIRQKSNQYILKSLETEGNYKPSFTDFQACLTYDITEKTELSFLGNYARNRYLLIPQTRETNFGTINEALRLTVYFDGQEVDKFETLLGALSLKYQPKRKTTLRFTTSVFNTAESETFDILGQYWLDQLEVNMSKEDDFGKPVFNRGVGTFLDHARNYLDATVWNIEHAGTARQDKGLLSWGVKYQKEIINDELKEWKLLDSAGYTLPRPPDSVGYVNPALQSHYPLEMKSFVAADVSLSSNRVSGYLQKKWNLDGDSTDFSLTVGVRANYWDLNSELLVSPRVKLSYRPNWRKDIRFRFAAGYYYQPPFYRELRDMNGNINTNLKAQKSIHFVGGSDWEFQIWERPFKFVTEVYYKFLDNLIPYEVDNVRVRYYAQNSARGYAVGIDMKINGEFVSGIESWASLSVMQTREDVKDDYYYEYFNNDGEKIVPGITLNNIAVDSTRREPGYIPRPTDQRVNFNLFFQDFLPNNPTYKMHLNLVFGSSLPFGPPSFERYKDTLRIPPYRRVDIGFSKQIKSAERVYSKNNPFRHFKTIWLTAEVFNLLQINNTISYLWIADISNRLYAIPNYLTPRQLNIRLVLEF